MVAGELRGRQESAPARGAAGEFGGGQAPAIDPANGRRRADVVTLVPDLDAHVDQRRARLSADR